MKRDVGGIVCVVITGQDRADAGCRCNVPWWAVKWWVLYADQYSKLFKDNKWGVDRTEVGDTEVENFKPGQQEDTAVWARRDLQSGSLLQVRRP